MNTGVGGTLGGREAGLGVEGKSVLGGRRSKAPERVRIPPVSGREEADKGPREHPGRWMRLAGDWGERKQALKSGLRHLVFLLSSVSGNSSHSAQPGQALNQTLLDCNHLSTFPDKANPARYSRGRAGIWVLKPAPDSWAEKSRRGLEWNRQKQLHHGAGRQCRTVAESQMELWKAGWWQA